MIYHAEMVGRAVSRALTIVDMPFPSNHLGKYQAIENAGRILKETRCQAVKLEGGADQAEIISGLVSAGIPVMAHCGLRPQNVHLLGGYKVQRDRDRLMREAVEAQEAGAFSVLLECIPAELAAEITAALRVPTIGIGAGAGCDGQVLVFHDVMGLTRDLRPRFVRKYADLSAAIEEAAKAFAKDVRDGSFPTEAESFSGGKPTALRRVY
jgi:3-methyl-2-oxobutanoate hydroxymethyltransferase